MSIISGLKSQYDSNDAYGMLHTYSVQVQFKFVHEEMFNKILTRKDTISVEMIFDMQ